MCDTPNKQNLYIIRIINVKLTVSYFCSLLHSILQTFQPGSVDLRLGNLADAAHRDFLTKGVTHIFFDNWDGVFSGHRGSTNWERTVAALFASTQEGTIMMTVSPLRAAMGCLPLTEANRIRTIRKLPTSTSASYYEMTQHQLGRLSDVYSFAGDNNDTTIDLYCYTRTTGSSDRKKGGVATLMCNNPACFAAQTGVVIEAVHKIKNEYVIQRCTCNFTERVLRQRKKRKK